MNPPEPSFGRPVLEVADLFRSETASFLQTHAGKLSSQQKRVFSDIQACRTAVMGGHVRQGNGCNHREIAYNSCRNRHCPKCQAMARAQWLVEREAELLPIAYFHIVFTLPAQVAALALQNKRLLYGMLFQDALSGRQRDAQASRRQPPAPGRSADRSFGRAACVGTESTAPPALPLCGQRRWPLAGRIPLDCVA